MKYLILLATIMTMATAASAHETEDGRIEFQNGPVEIVDGDTVWIGIHQIRLHGIDTVEPKQQCWNNEENVGCHEHTLDALHDLIDGTDFHCHGHIGKDEKPIVRYSRYVATCYANGIEVNRAMVESGWALAAHNKDGDGYRDSETKAKEQKLGLHQWTFEIPHDFRNPPEKGCTCE